MKYLKFAYAKQIGNGPLMCEQILQGTYLLQEQHIGHELVISYVVGVEFLRLGDKLRQGATKDKSSRAEVQKVGPWFTAVRPFNIQW